MAHDLSYVSPMEGVTNMMIASDDYLDPSLSVDQLIASTFESEEARSQPQRRYLEEHHVVLKTRSLPTKGTRIFRDHVKDAMGRKMLDDDELKKLKKLQDAYYNCKCDGVEEETVVFWVNLEDTDASLTNQREDVRYARIKNEDVAVVRATDECLRVFLKDNGRKRKKKENPADEGIDLPTPQQSANSAPKPPPKVFLLEGEENLKERAMAVCQTWVSKSVHWAESTAKQHLVAKFEKDLDEYKLMLEENALCCEEDNQSKHPQEQEYDRYRQRGHESLLVDIINRMGNRMVEWYNQDHMNRMSNLALSFQAPPGGSAPGNGPNQGGNGWNGYGTGGGPTGFGTGIHPGLGSGGDGNTSSTGPSDSYDTSSYESGQSYSSYEGYDGSSSEESVSTWTVSTWDDSSSCMTSLTDDGNDDANNGEIGPIQSQGVSALSETFDLNEAVDSLTVEDKENVIISVLSESRNERSDLQQDGTEGRAVANGQAQDLNRSEGRFESSSASAFVAEGASLHAKGDYLGALVAYRRAQKMLEAIFSSSHPATAKVYYEIGCVLHDQDDFKGALGEYQKALACWESSLQRERKPDTAKALYNIGNVLSAYNSAKDSIYDSTRRHPPVLGERRQVPFAPICC